MPHCIPCSLECGSPSGAVPSGAVPSDAVPSGAVPSGAVPSGAVPSGAVPSGAVPSGAVPSDAVPSGGAARVCGGDGVTYESRCHLQAAGCRIGRAIKFAYDGKCLGRFEAC